MEAQLAGTPIVASNAGGIPEMMEYEHTGLLFDVGDEEQLAQQLERMLKDPQLRTNLAEKAKEWAERQWSSDTLMQRTLSAYDAALRKVKGV